MWKGERSCVASVHCLMFLWQPLWQGRQSGMECPGSCHWGVGCLRTSPVCTNMWVCSRSPSVLEQASAVARDRLICAMCAGAGGADTVMFDPCVLYCALWARRQIMILAVVGLWATGKTCVSCQLPIALRRVCVSHNQFLPAAVL